MSASHDANNEERSTPFHISLISGGLAGTTVDVTLYPLDTLKTRLQSPHGFWKSGGFKGIYRGVGAAFVGSAPGAALFFSCYETLKVKLSSSNSNGAGNNYFSNMIRDKPIFVHMIAATCGEIGACLVRVPTEVIKQNMQVSTSTSSSQNNSLKETVKMILNQKQSRASTFLSPIFGGLYRGYGITLMREIPFAMIQFPLYEYMKSQISDYKKQHYNNQNNEQDILTTQYDNEEKKIYDDGVSPTESAICGSISGAIAAALTTPLDVIKTRLMIGKDSQGVEYKNAIDVFQRIMKDEGKRVLWKGIEPRVLWISIGGFVFFGAYEEYRSIMIKVSGYSS